MSQQMIIVGLGNPGKRYAETRHNVGFMVVERLAHQLGLTIKKEKNCEADVAKGVVGNTSWHCLFPMTYMNLSGNAVRRYLDYYDLSVEDLLVVSDDVEIPFGQLRLKEGGGAGGHNGLKSLQQQLATQNYKRLRVGVGAPGKEGNPWIPLDEFVLSPFALHERQGLEELLKAAVEAIRCLENEEISKVMSAFNNKTWGGSAKLTTPTPNGAGDKNETKETKPL